jgi:hypothetical protein
MPVLSYQIQTAGCSIVNIGRFEPQVKYKEGFWRPKSEGDSVPAGQQQVHSTSEKWAIVAWRRGQVHYGLSEVDSCGALPCARGK